MLWITEDRSNRCLSDEKGGFEGDSIQAMDIVLATLSLLCFELFPTCMLYSTARAFQRQATENASHFTVSKKTDGGVSGRSGTTQTHNQQRVTAANLAIHRTGGRLVAASS